MVDESTPAAGRGAEARMTCEVCGEPDHGWCGWAWVHEERCALPEGPCDCIVATRRRAQGQPLAGHRAGCAKVTTATITGRTDGVCSCGAADQAPDVERTSCADAVNPTLARGNRS